jgi:hypothetical protein
LSEEEADADGGASGEKNKQRREQVRTYFNDISNTSITFHDAHLTESEGVRLPACLTTPHPFPV